MGSSSNLRASPRWARPCLSLWAVPGCQPRRQVGASPAPLSAASHGPSHPIVARVPPPNLGPSSSFSEAPPGSCPPNGRGLGARGAAHEPAHPICTLAAAAVKLLAGKAAFTRGPREPPPPRGPLSEPEAEGSLCAPDPAHPSDVQPATPTYLPLAPRFSSLMGLSQRKRCSFYRSLIYCSFCFHRMSPNPTSPKLSPGFFFGTLCRFLFYV